MQETRLRKILSSSRVSGERAQPAIVAWPAARACGDIDAQVIAPDKFARRLVVGRFCLGRISFCCAGLRAPCCGACCNSCSNWLRREEKPSWVTSPGG